MAGASTAGGAPRANCWPAGRATRIVLALATSLVLDSGPSEGQHRSADPRAVESGIPFAVRDLSITANGAPSRDVSGDETASFCARFRLGIPDVREFLASAEIVDARAYGHDLEMSRCHAAGRVMFVGGERGRWRIDMQRRGLLVLADGRRRYLYCRTCTSGRYDAVYDPDRDG